MANQWDILEYIKGKYPEWVTKEEIIRGLDKGGDKSWRQNLNNKINKLEKADFIFKRGIPFSARAKVKRKCKKQKLKERKKKLLLLKYQAKIRQFERYIP